MIDESVVDYLFNTNFLMSKEKIACANKSAHTVSLHDSFKMQISFNSCTTGSTDEFLLPLYAQPDAEHCEHGCKPIRRFKKSDDGVTVLKGLARFSPMFPAELIQSENIEVSQVGKVLRTLMSSSSMYRRSTAKTSLLHLNNEMKQKENSTSFTTECMVKFLLHAGFPACWDSVIQYPERKTRGRCLQKSYFRFATLTFRKRLWPTSKWSVLWWIWIKVEVSQQSFFERWFLLPTLGILSSMVWFLHKPKLFHINYVCQILQFLDKRVMGFGFVWKSYR